MDFPLPLTLVLMMEEDAARAAEPSAARLSSPSTEGTLRAAESGVFATEPEAARPVEKSRVA
jgi:hypothetical protein